MTTPADAGMSMWRSALIRLGIASAAIIALFAGDGADMARLWWTSSTFGHCLVIAPIIGWLVWLRKDALAQLTPRLWWPGLIWIGAGAAGWLVGEAAGVALFRQAGLVLMLQGCVPALLGPQVTMGLVLPLFYALFMVPFGEELVPPMQLLTADMAMVMLRLSGIPAHLDGIFITTPVGLFAVAEACSGVKFLVAMTALAVLAAHLCFIRWRRRLTFVVLALAATVLANGVRAYGTIWMAETWGMSTAIGADHLVYGWIFFGLVIALIFAVARHWFDRSPDAAMIDPARLRTLMPGAGAMPMLLLPLVMLIAAAPLLWVAIASTGGAALVAPGVPVVPDWQRIDPPQPASVPWRARYDGADQRTDWQYADADGHRVDVTIVGYARQDEGREIVGFGQGAVDPDSNWRWAHALDPIGPARFDRIAITGATRDVLTAYYLDGEVTGSEQRVKWRTLTSRLTADDQRAYALVIAAEARGDLSGEAQVRTFVSAAGGVETLLRGLTQGR